MSTTDKLLDVLKAAVRLTESPSEFTEVDLKQLRDDAYGFIRDFEMMRVALVKS